jgi:acyl carrier protein
LVQQNEQLISDLKNQIVETLEMEDLTADQIETDAPLFKEGLGLDSIDALELVVMVERCHGIKMKKMAEAKNAFRSVRTLAEFISNHKAANA